LRAGSRYQAGPRFLNFTSFLIAGLKGRRARSPSLPPRPVWLKCRSPR